MDELKEIRNAFQASKLTIEELVERLNDLSTNAKVYDRAGRASPDNRVRLTATLELVELYRKARGGKPEVTLQDALSNAVTEKGPSAPGLSSLEDGAHA